MCHFGTSGRSTFSVMSVTSVSPTSGCTNTPTFITNLPGTDFQRSARVSLENGAIARHAMDVVGSSANTMSRRLGLKDVAVGGYDVVVRNPDGSKARPAGGFNVVAFGAGSGTAILMTIGLFVLMSAARWDGCEPWVLEMAGVAKTDLVLAVTGDDEDNLVVSYLSKFEYDVPKVIARVNNPLNRWLFTRSWGVDVEVSTPDVIARIIEEETTLGEVVTVMKLQASDIGLVEITLPDDAEALGKSLAELELPPETLIVTVVRSDGMMIPKADTILQPNDRVLAITNVHHQDALKRVLGHRP